MFMDKMKFKFTIGTTFIIKLPFSENQVIKISFVDAEQLSAL